MIMESKRCSKCGETKSLFEYHKKNDGTQHYCKSCKKELNKGFNSNRSNYARQKYPTLGNIGVYALTHKNKIIYIGSSDNLPFRLYRHFRCNGSFNDGLKPFERQYQYRWEILKYFNKLKDANEYERLAIRTLKPKYNITTYKNEQSIGDWRSSLSLRLRRLSKVFKRFV